MGASDVIVGVDPDGTIAGELSLAALEAVEGWTLEALSRGELARGDMFHTNTIEIIGRDVPGMARAGDLLVCLRNLDRVAVIDPQRKEVVWSWGEGELDRPHHPQLLENGNLLLLDNGMHRGRSRVLEIDPSERRIVWKYEGDPPPSFFTRIMGSAQRLENGNTLITESQKGRIFEVTSEGEIVWEWWVPEYDAEGRRLAVPRMVRIGRAEGEALLARAGH